jgi:ribosomal protein S6--L-glutamate ligase
MKKKVCDTPKLISGWREWAALPDLQVEKIKVKLDTGARTSSLHAFEIEPFVHDGEDWLQFDVHPLQDNERVRLTCRCPIVDYRWITSSSGHKQKRFIIQTTLKMGEFSSLIEISLANRDEMGFRMLIGRNALKGRVLVDSSHSFLLTHRPKLTKK